MILQRRNIEPTFSAKVEYSGGCKEQEMREVADPINQ
jgi:hypothetical protein